MNKRPGQRDFTPDAEQIKTGYPIPLNIDPRLKK